MCCLKTKVNGCFTAINLSVIFQGSSFKRFHFVKRIFHFFYQMAVCNDNSASTYQNGNTRNGTHFSNIKSPDAIQHKLRSYLHHREFDEEPLSVNQIDNIIKNKQAIYDLKVDKKVNKIGNGSELEEYPLSKLPLYLQENKEKYKLWLD